MTISGLSDQSVAERVLRVRESIAEQCLQIGRDPGEISIMAVTKTVASARVNEAVAAGITLLGENRAQELDSKYEEYDRQNTQIHFIGHLQSNKVRQIIDKVTMIQSLDSISLAREIQRQCEKRDITMDCLVEVNIGNEHSKSGIEVQYMEKFMNELLQFNRIKVRGMMSIPPIFTDLKAQEQCFSNLYKLYVDISAKKIDNVTMDILSMGMSGDYLAAIKHGSNLVRLGSILFGQRSYA